MQLGCIGDDFTGSSDLANTLAKGGLLVTQYVGVPSGAAPPEVEAGVVSLKSRNIPAAEAVQQSLEALDWLRAQGCSQFFFKYCSTFDSTDEGNIGPVADALMEALGTGIAIVCPAFPAVGRTLYEGHLFVGDRLLSESGMQNHPITPMRDPDIRRVLARQTRQPVRHIPHRIVRAGSAAISDALSAATGLAVVDAIDDEDLLVIGRAAKGHALITGGSGIALGLPANHGAKRLAEAGLAAWQAPAGDAVVLSGSCSQRTREQVAAHLGSGAPAFQLDTDLLARGGLSPSELAAWARVQEGLPLIYSSGKPDEVKEAQQRHGAHAIASAIEAFFARLARELAAIGFTRIISAGGETSGAVVSGLRLTALRIGPEIDPGVPALMTEDGRLALALKSGNFGGADFFAKAARKLGGAA